MRSKIHRFIQNFIPWKMIDHLPRKFIFPSSPFCEHFRQLREKYKSKRQIVENLQRTMEHLKHLIDIRIRVVNYRYNFLSR